MPYTIEVNTEYTGLPLGDLLPILDELPEPVEVLWEGSPEELRLYEQNRWTKKNEDRAFKFIVKDTKALDRTLWALGGSVPLTPEEIETARKALVSRGSSDWRLTMEAMGTTRGTLVLMKLLGDSLRKGNLPVTTCMAALDCLHTGVNPQDVDLLLRLRSAR